MSGSYLTSHWLIVSSVPLLLLASSCSVMMLQQPLCFDSLQITISQVSAPAFKQGICLLGQGQKGIVVSDEAAFGTSSSPIAQPFPSLLSQVRKTISEPLRIP